MTYKICASCKVSKDIELFDKNKAGTFGCQSYCKQCRRDKEALRKIERNSIYNYEGPKTDVDAARIVLTRLNYVLDNPDNPIYLQFNRRMQLKGVDISNW